MSQYTNASAAEALANGVVIPQYKPFLANWDIAYVMNSGSMKSKGVETWAKIKKCSPLDKHLNGHDLLVIINEAMWHRLTPDQRIALLHHEFCHVDENDEGELVMLTHDLEEFAEVVRCHGLWRPGVEHFASQLTLTLNEGVAKPMPHFDPHAPGDAEDGAAMEPKDGVDTVTITGNGRSVTMTDDEFARAAASLDRVEAAVNEVADEIAAAETQP